MSVVIPGHQRRRNQSEMHQRLSQMALRWIANRATLKGWRGGVEISLVDWKVCDALVVCGLQRRLRQRYDVPSCYWHDLICVFESKATIADFRKDFNPRNHLKRPGNLRWVVVDFDLPYYPCDSWGVLKRCGRGLREVIKPQFLMASFPEMLSAYENIAWKESKREQVILPCPDCGQLLRPFSETTKRIETFATRFDIDSGRLQSALRAVIASTIQGSIASAVDRALMECADEQLGEWLDSAARTVTQEGDDE